MSGALEAALAYAARGWPAFPLHGIRGGRCTCGAVPDCKPGKHPLGRLVPAGVKNATTEAVKITSWSTNCPIANVAIGTGGVSGLVALDVDPRHGGDASLEALVREHGPLPDTIESLTGGGGRHLVFRHPGGVVPNRVGIAPGLDVRGDGGYIVAPPSLHISERRYAWAIGYGADEVPLAAAPEWLTTLVTSDASRWVSGGRLRCDGTPLVIHAGERNDRLARLGGALRRYGLGEAALMDCLVAINREHCRPPLDRAEVQKIAASVARYAAGEGLFPPFQPSQACRSDELVTRALGVVS